MVTKKTFDAVAESRNWRIASGRRLSRMSRDDRLAYLNEDVDAKLKEFRRRPEKPSRTSRTPGKRSAKL